MPRVPLHHVLRHPDIDAARQARAVGEDDAGGGCGAAVAGGDGRVEAEGFGDDGVEEGESGFAVGGAGEGGVGEGRGAAGEEGD